MPKIFEKIPKLNQITFIFSSIFFLISRFIEPLRFINFLTNGNINSNDFSGVLINLTTNIIISIVLYIIVVGRLNKINKGKLWFTGFIVFLNPVWFLVLSTNIPIDKTIFFAVSSIIPFVNILFIAYIASLSDNQAPIVLSDTGSNSGIDIDVNNNLVIQNQISNNLSYHDHLKSFGIILFAFLAGVSPFFMCFDGCASGQLLLPLFAVPAFILTLFSLFNPYVWFFKLIFFIPFWIYWAYIIFYSKTESSINNSSLKRSFFIIFAYIFFYIVVKFVWFYLIPEPLRFVWLGQHG